MKVLVTGFPQGKKIQAIKAVRAAGAMGLKDAKDVMDAVELGGTVTIKVSTDRLGDLDEGGVVYRPDVPAMPVEQLADALELFPRDLTIGTLLSVLEPVAEVQRQAAALQGTQLPEEGR